MRSKQQLDRMQAFAERVALEHVKATLQAELENKKNEAPTFRHVAEHAWTMAKAMEEARIEIS